MDQSSASGPVLFIVGPTAVGKTRLAVAMARRFNGEIINADSRQVYRYMDVGSGKPTTEERTQARHHLLDILNPDEDFGLATFLSLARLALAEIRSRRRIPIVAGGAGQYIWALAEGWQAPQVPPDQSFRRQKQLEAELHGVEFVYSQLKEADPERASRLDPRNVRRVIRALEIHLAVGAVPLPLSRGGGPAQRPLENRLIIGLTAERQQLYRQIDARVDHMLALGLEGEVRGLVAKGYRLDADPLGSPGYKELGQYLMGEATLDEAVNRTKLRTHRMARRQYTWFKPSDDRIRWLNSEAPELEEEAERLVHDFLSGPACYDTITRDTPITNTPEKYPRTF